MPFDMAMEEPNARIVGAEAHDNVAIWTHHEGVAAHGYFWKCRVTDIVPCVVIGTCDGLEGVAVEMERMFAWVGIVEDDVNDLAFGEDECVGVDAINGGICCGVTGGKGGIESRNFRFDVGYVVEEGARLKVSK